MDFNEKDFNEAFAAWRNEKLTVQITSRIADIWNLIRLLRDTGDTGGIARTLVEQIVPAARKQGIAIPPDIESMEIQ